MADSRWAVVDLGCKRGGAVPLFLKTCRTYFGENLADGHLARCLGVDKDPARREDVERLGYAFWCADVEELLAADYPAANYYVAWNFLEHLSSRDAARTVLRCMMGAAVRGVSLLLPSFELDPQLEHAGLRFVWTRWSGHPARVLVEDVESVVEALSGWSMQVEQWGEVRTSADDVLVPDNDAAEWDVQRYTEAMGLKAHVVFDPPVATRYRVDIRRWP